MARKDELLEEAYGKMLESQFDHHVKRIDIEIANQDVTTPAGILRSSLAATLQVDTTNPGNPQIVAVDDINAGWELVDPTTGKEIKQNSIETTSIPAVIEFFKSQKVLWADLLTDLESAVTTRLESDDDRERANTHPMDRKPNQPWKEVGVTKFANSNY